MAMTQFLFWGFVAAGLLLMMLLAAIMLSAVRTGTEQRQFQKALGLESPSGGLPPRDLAVCVFALSDLEFVAASNCKPLLSFFLAERRRLAISWLQTIRREVAGVVASHRAVVKASPVFRPGVEVRLAMLLGRFFVSYCLLFAMLRFYGPFAARHFVTRLLVVSEGLANLQASILACLTSQTPVLSTN